MVQTRKQAQKGEMTGAQDHTGDRAGIYVQVYASRA